MTEGVSTKHLSKDEYEPPTVFSHFSAMILDCQVHAYEADNPARPWAHTLTGPLEITGEQLIAAMDTAGVDAAILVSPWMLYRYDASYALSVRADFPDRISIVKPIDILDPAVAEVVEQWAQTEGAIAIRIFEVPDNPLETHIDAALRAAARCNLPVNVICFERHERIAEWARMHPHCRFALDHMGIRPPLEPPVPAAPFTDLDAVLELARFDNISIKMSGLGTLSLEGYPFHDIHDPIHRVLDTFGINRCMWGTDWTRATRFLTYRQGVDAFRLHMGLSDNDRTALMSGTAQRFYDWWPKGGAQRPAQFTGERG